ICRAACPSNSDTAGNSLDFPASLRPTVLRSNEAKAGEIASSSVSLQNRRHNDVRGIVRVASAKGSSGRHGRVFPQHFRERKPKLPRTASTTGAQNMKTRYFATVTLIFALTSAVSRAQVSLTGTSYSENFNGMTTNIPGSSATPTGWFVGGVGAGTNGAVGGTTVTDSTGTINV